MHLLLMGVLPMMEVLHDHHAVTVAELHRADGECEHERHGAGCALLGLGSVPAVLATAASWPPHSSTLAASTSPASAADLPDAPASPALPRAPPRI
ncbi:hypothetical protein [Candidatus Palauibacter sp.]|uniref:hypothetical protein n=1 Tax=Candidatus Palauibacter sp. TaxID=3101350 RepID=UPI003B01785B